MAVDRQIDEEIRELKDSVRRLASGQIKGAGGQNGGLKAVQLEQRIQDLERSRSSNSGAFEPPAGVLLALGSAYFRNGSRDDAETHWTEAVRVNAKLGGAWNNLAVVYLQSARKPMAEDAVKRAERAGFRVNPRLKDDIKRMPGSLSRYATAATARDAKCLVTVTQRAIGDLASLICWTFRFCRRVLSWPGS